jgi:uncharacterized membrane protein YwzB
MTQVQSIDCTPKLAMSTFLAGGSMDRITKKEKKEILRFLVLLLAIVVVLVVMCLVLGYLASRLPIASGNDQPG